MTNNKDLNYIAECAESVGIHVDEHTAISIPFIADVMRKMREQSNSDEDCISRADAIKAIRNYNVTIEVSRAIGKSQLADIVDSINKVQEKMISELPSVQPKPKTDVFDKIRTEIHATAEMHEDGDYYLRDEWIDEIIDKYTAESEGKE